ncbi:MAG: hypothetical protein N2C12_02640, partial [Planctomycetales bacterium]
MKKNGELRQHMSRRESNRPALQWLAIVYLCLVSPSAKAATPWDPVNQISQSQYETYQVAIQDMGLGLYGGPAYDQGYRNRYNTGGSATASLG